MVADQNVFVCKQEQSFICPLSEDFILYYLCTKKKITNNHVFNCNNENVHCKYKQDESIMYSVDKVHYIIMIEKKIIVFTSHNNIDLPKCKIYIIYYFLNCKKIKIILYLFDNAYL